MVPSERSTTPVYTSGEAGNEARELEERWGPLVDFAKDIESTSNVAPEVAKHVGEATVTAMNAGRQVEAQEPIQGSTVSQETTLASSETNETPKTTNELIGGLLTKLEIDESDFDKKKARRHTPRHARQLHGQSHTPRVRDTEQPVATEEPKERRFGTATEAEVLEKVGELENLLRKAHAFMETLESKIQTLEQEKETLEQEKADLQRENDALKLQPLADKPEAAPTEDQSAEEPEVSPVAQQDATEPETMSASEYARMLVADAPRDPVTKPFLPRSKAQSKQSDTSPVAEPAKEVTTYNSKDITVTQAVPHPTDKSQDALFILDKDGNQQIIKASQVLYENAEKPQDQPPFVEKTPGTDVELYQHEGREAILVRPEVQKQKRGIKQWWAKAQEGMYKAVGAAHWVGEWAREKHSQWLEHGITDEMTDDEKQKKRERNRTAAVIATGAVGGIVLAGIAYATAKGIADATAHGVGAQELNGAPGVGSWQERDAAHKAYLESLQANGGTSGGAGFSLPLEGAPDATTIPEVSPGTGGAITAFDGEGGEALFGRYNIPTSFYDVQWSLLDKFPQDFMINPSGDGVWVSHAGPLSNEAQEAIKALR